MSPIGRIFIVLNLLLSAAFLGWASSSLAQSQDYKAKFEDKKAEMAEAVADKENEISKLQVSNNQLSDESRTFRNERDQAASEAERLKTDLAEAKRDNDNLRSSIAKIESTLGDYNGTINSLLAEKDRAVQQAHEMESERNDANDRASQAELARRDAQDALRTASEAIAELEVARTTLEDQVSQLETDLAVVVDLTGVKVNELTSQPLINGSVLDVRLDLQPGLVMLNVGKNQNVKRGFTFDIYRGSVYKGQVRVSNVQDDIASATIVRNVDGQTIQQGDRATTRL